MASKKDKNKDFGQNPFRDLKGFSVSAAAAPPAPTQAVAPPVSPQPQALDDAALFAAEMALLGLAGSEVPGTKGSPPADASGGSEDSPAMTDQALFLQGLSGMDVVFADDLGDAEQELPLPAPRRMKLVRQGRLLPQATLDLHGLHRDQARDKVRWFLDDAVYQGYRTVLLITGRGKSSGGDAVLRAEMERYLGQEAKAWVAEWGRAPGRLGGEGALVVFLKGKPQG